MGKLTWIEVYFRLMWCRNFHLFLKAYMFIGGVICLASFSNSILAEIFISHLFPVTYTNLIFFLGPEVPA